MPDREKVIEALDHCMETKCKGCPYLHEESGSMCYDTLMGDAAELLKAQEPRVLSLEEVLGGDECWFEYINGYCGHVNAYMEEDNITTIIYRTNVRPVEVLITDYMKKWRCWSDRPTGEQRKLVKWDG